MDFEFMFIRIVCAEIDERSHVPMETRNERA
jgi:hypothetical protein